MKIGWIRYPQKLYETGRVTKGGSERANQYVIDYLRSRGQEVVEFMPETTERVDLIDLPALGTPLIFQDLLKKIDEINKCDVLFTTNWFGAILPELKIPLVTVFHSNASLVMDAIKEENIVDKDVLNKWLEIAKNYHVAKSSSQRDHEKVISLGEKYFATKSDRMIAVSQLLEDSLVKFYGANPEKITLVYNSFDKDWLSVNTDKDFKENLTVVDLTRLPDDFDGFIGKGADRVLEIFSRINLPKVLIASGRPDSYRELISHYIKNVKLVENADHRTVARELSKAHISIHCSRCEACQLTLMEAMLMKTVPISFKIGVAPEFIEHGKNGFLVDDVREVEKYVNQLNDDKNLTKEMAEAARKSIVEKCSIDKIGGKYLDLIGSL